MKELVEALQIMMKYDPNGSVGGADHDVIYLSYVNADKISPEDTKRLEELGCHLEDTDLWAMFV